MEVVVLRVLVVIRRVVVGAVVAGGGVGCSGGGVLTGRAPTSTQRLSSACGPLDAIRIAFVGFGVVVGHLVVVLVVGVDVVVGVGVVGVVSTAAGVEGVDLSAKRNKSAKWLRAQP